MIALIEGEVHFSDHDRSIILAAGVGYEVRIPSAVIVAMMEDGKVYLPIWHVIREADQVLYGFRTMEDRDLAVLITGCAGVGPAKASSLIHGAGATAVVAAVRTGDAASLPKVKGLSKDGIASILAYLKTQDLPHTTDPRVAQALGVYRGIHGEPTQALIAAVEKLAPEHPRATAVQLMRAAMDGDTSRIKQ